MPSVATSVNGRIELKTTKSPSLIIFPVSAGGNIMWKFLLTETLREGLVSICMDFLTRWDTSTLVPRTIFIIHGTGHNDSLKFSAICNEDVDLCLAWGQRVSNWMQRRRDETNCFWAAFASGFWGKWSKGQWWLSSTCYLRKYGEKIEIMQGGSWPVFILKASNN